ncbi:hypothetical protein IST461_02809 [Burkholderia multivorans]|nr:hypothetical protein IST461_02809 [Burkholderia multivorans]
MRQPQVSKPAPEISRASRIAPKESSKPTVAAAVVHDTLKPRRRFGECSATYVRAPVYSPPAANPCSIRNAMSVNGAHRPTLSYVGSSPTPIVAPPIMQIVTTKVRLRPIRSPMRPKISAPSGRIVKPTPNVSRANRNAVFESTPEKNLPASTAASDPYNAKSYHSNAVPIDAAHMACDNGTATGGEEGGAHESALTD